MRPYNFTGFSGIIALNGFTDGFLMKQSRIPAWHVSILHGESLISVYPIGYDLVCFGEICTLSGIFSLILPDGFSPIPS